MGLRVKLEMLAVLLFLTPLMSNGLLVPKCELVDKLELIVPQDMMDRENLLAQLVCRAEMTSQFETSHINQVSPQDILRGRKTRAIPKISFSPTTNNPLPKTGIAKTTTNPRTKTTTNPTTKTTTKPPRKSTTTLKPKTTTKPPRKSTTNPPLNSNTNPPPISNVLDTTEQPTINQTKEKTFTPSNYSPMQGTPPSPPNYNYTYKAPRNRRGFNELWFVYGLFQLADGIACTSSPIKPSFNICKLPCDTLIDDDFTNDINCALTILNTWSDMKANAKVEDESRKLVSKFAGMLKDTCPNLDSAGYLSECQNP